MTPQLDGIAERLKRAKENIQNLEIEINGFLEKKGHREIVHRDPKDIEQFKKFWSKQSVPPRFSVLTSEILHHYRSALDNLVWKLLQHAECVPANPNIIEFPILPKRPTASDKPRVFDRKIEGVGNKASAIIEALQPYNAVSQWQDPFRALIALHDMNRFDKHRELTVVGSQAQQKPEVYLVQVSEVRKDTATGHERKIVLGHREVYVGMKLTALIAFRKFGDNGPDNYPLIAGLNRIDSVVTDVIDKFHEVFKKIFVVDPVGGIEII